MQLKKLEIFGFKSFSDKTSFAFESGITGIVGPNGCGKSNVVDAIKWILGDQSAKSLRGNEMSDVIFNGTNKRSSMGYAEASLTILNDRNLLPIEYEEVCITRRLYTSGESEYLINKQTSRLKDIKELFMDTGVGANCYSLIEQGKVDTLLQANAQERRFVFEEAAGISKYKTKKKEAMSKLEKVEQNLLRLNDIIEEVQKQLRSVKLQASKAVKYNEYVDRLKNLSIKLSLKKYRTFKDKRTGILDQIQQKEDQERCLPILKICKLKRMDYKIIWTD
jgi:chromosome segregation protein